MKPIKLSPEERIAIDDEILADIKGILVECGMPMDHCPPAFYPEAIAKMRAFTVQGVVDCLTFHKHTDMDTINACATVAIPKLAESFEKLKQKALAKSSDSKVSE